MKSTPEYLSDATFWCHLTPSQQNQVSVEADDPQFYKEALYDRSQRDEKNAPMPDFRTEL